MENSLLSGCEHCHDTIIEWDTGEVRRITDRDESISVNGGRSAQNHIIVGMNHLLSSNRTLSDLECPDTICDPRIHVPSLWNDVVNFMSEKEPLPLPYNELDAKTFLMNCYDNVDGGAYTGCPEGPDTMDNECHCIIPPPTIPPSTTSTSTTSTTSGPSTTTTSTSSTTTSSTTTTSTTSTTSPCDGIANLRERIRCLSEGSRPERPPRPTVIRPARPSIR